MNSRRFGLTMIVLSIVALFLVLGLRESVHSVQAERSVAPANGAATPQKTLPVVGEVSDFTLIDSTGAELGLNDLKGHIWVADLMFTSCAGTCPTLAHNMRSVQEALAGDPAVHFVSISVDPDTDTPEQMGAYADRMGADLDTWHFLTGPTDVVQDLAVNGFKVGSGDEPLIHSNRFVLIDPNGHVRGYFLGTESEEIPRLIEAIDLLKSEFGL